MKFRISMLIVCDRQIICIESARSCKSHERAQIIRGKDSVQKPASNGTDEVLMKIQKMLSTPKNESQDTHEPSFAWK